MSVTSNQLKVDRSAHPPFEFGIILPRIANSVTGNEIRV
jgi:hypothetical protein